MADLQPLTVVKSEPLPPLSIVRSEPLPDFKTSNAKDAAGNAMVGDLALEGLKGVADVTVTPIWQTLKAFATAGLDPQHSDPLGDMVRGIVGAHKDQYYKGKQAFREGRYSEAAGHFTAAGLPMVGPAAAQAGELIGTGDPAQVARGAGQAVGLIGPSVARTVVPKVVEQLPSVETVRRGVSRATTAVGNALDNPIVGLIEPRAQAAGRILRVTGEVVRPKGGETLAPAAIPEALPTAIPEVAPASTLTPPKNFNPSEAYATAQEVFDQLKQKPRPAELSNAMEFMRRGHSAEAAVLKVLERRPESPADRFAARFNTPTDADVAGVVAEKNTRTTWQKGGTKGR